MEIKLKEFQRLNLKVGKIKAVKKHPQTNDYILLIDIGPTGADKQIVAKLDYKMEELAGRKVILVQNTEPISIKGIESVGLLLTASKAGRPVLIEPPKGVCIGAKVAGLCDKEVGFKK